MQVNLYQGLFHHKDRNKKIADSQYNFLNLPGLVTFSDGSTVTYTYSADGTKLRTVHRIGTVTTTTDYCGNVIYENGFQKMLLTEEGYVSLNNNAYHVYLKDHLGNVRVVTQPNGTLDETTHYYPLGSTFTGPYAATSVQPFKYNGKELDRKKGLNWYDYGARHYDAVLGRWHAVDPSSEKYYWASPYVYCNNNPVKNVDLDGRDWYMNSETGELYFNRTRDQMQISYKDRSYIRIGGNDMMGEMKDITEQSYSFEESSSLANANGYSINPIQELRSEVSREQTYPAGKNTITITTGEVEIINEQYGVFPVERSEGKFFKTETLRNPEYGILDYLDAIATGAKKTNLVERNYLTYKKSTLGNKASALGGVVYNAIETMTGKHDYRNVTVYKSWNDYLKGGKNRMLPYKK